MGVSGLMVAALTVGMASPVLAQGFAMPLPDKTDIPDTYATALCPDVAAGKKMMSDYLVPGQSFADPEVFVAGLEATGCAYDNSRVGDITIEAVIERLQVQKGETFILYRGTKADGSSVVGLVHEEGNNAHPRTPLEEWIAYNTIDGTITLAEGERGAYWCPTPDMAMAVVDAIAAAADTDEKVAALKLGVAQYFCPPAVGEFQISDVLGETYIDGGFEAEEVWTALGATDATGKSMGLLYDASPFR